MLLSSARSPAEASYGFRLAPTGSGREKRNCERSRHPWLNARAPAPWRRITCSHLSSDAPSALFDEDLAPAALQSRRLVASRSTARYAVLDHGATSARRQVAADQAQATAHAATRQLTRRRWCSAERRQRSHQRGRVKPAEARGLQAAVQRGGGSQGMHLVGRLSNPPNASVKTVLDAYPDGLSRRPQAKIVPARTKRLGNGVVQRALVKALIAAGRPMGVGEAHMAVEALLGHSVSRDSVNSCLSTGARVLPPSFQRVGPGRYQLCAL